jgi:hypothetical protein
MKKCVGAFIVLAMFVFGCATDRGVWRDTLKKNTIQAYQEYLSKYPNGAFRYYAKKQMEYLIEKQDYNQADSVGNMESYESFLKKHPNGAYAFPARQKIAALVEERTWQKARQDNIFKSYSDYLSSYPRGKHAEEARKAIPNLYFLSDTQISQIESQQRTSVPNVEGLENVEKLLFNGANCIDGDGHWTNIARGRKIYDILKHHNSKLLTEGMTCVVLMQVNRLRVLFLVVKLGISGTQTALNDLLMKYGDKEMAEDYLNCGSKELHEGGAAWARANGYFIFSGYGSHRVSWGSF